MAIWDEEKDRFPEGGGKVIPADDDASGVAPASVEVVQKPAFRKKGQRMYAAVGSSNNGAIYGLFAADPVGDRPDDGDVKLIRLGTIEGLVSDLID